MKFSFGNESAKTARRINPACVLVPRRRGSTGGGRHSV